LPSTESAAAKSFARTLGLSSALLSLDRAYHDPPRPEEQIAVEALRGAAAVLMVAAFENFLRDCTLEHLGRLQPPGKVKLSHFPEPIVLQSVFASMNSAIRGAPSRSQRARLPDVRLAAHRIATETIDPLAFADTGSNPNSAQVRAMFKPFGEIDVYLSIKSRFDKEWKIATPSTFIPDKLDEIVRRRHVVAHTANALNITRSELRDSVRFLKLLARLLDSELRRRVKSSLRVAIKTALSSS